MPEVQKWEQPPAIKIYEALGAVADGRIEVGQDGVRVYSSSRKKQYEVTYNAVENAIMANDNGSYWKGYLGYPAIAFLMRAGVLEYKEEYAKLLKSIPWKDINVRFKNDFARSLDHILSSLTEENKKGIEAYVASVEKQISALGLKMLGPKKKPPQGY